MSERRTTTNAERYNALTDAHDELLGYRDALRDAVDGLYRTTRHLPDSIGERLRRGVIAHVEKAIDDDRGRVGTNMTTLADIIDEVEAEMEADNG